MEKVFTLSHKVIVPTDFTGFVSLSEMEKTAVLFDLVSTVNELEKKTKTLEMASRPQEQDTEPPAADTADTVKPVDVAPKAKVASTGKNGAHHKGGRIGVQTGKTCKYRYISYDKKKNVYIAETEDRGKRLRMGRDKDPVALALKVDAFLDKFEADNPTAKKRPRNKNFHPEIMKLYVAQQPQEEK